MKLFAAFAKIFGRLNSNIEAATVQSSSDNAVDG